MLNNSLRMICVLAGCGIWFLSTLHAADPKFSDLWGRQGERWSAESRLPDFSYAGYHRGEKPLPTLAPDCSIKDFGAAGDGKTDDTQAFHANLFTNIDLGEGSRMFQSGGGAALSRHSAAWETFWSIRSRREQTWPQGWGPDLMNLVGLPSSDAVVTESTGRWFEPIAADRLEPANLYEAQLARRLNTAQ